jgi:hypothetical protein
MTDVFSEQYGPWKTLHPHLNGIHADSRHEGLDNPQSHQQNSIQHSASRRASHIEGLEEIGDTGLHRQPSSSELQTIGGQMPSRRNSFSGTPPPPLHQHRQQQQQQQPQHYNQQPGEGSVKDSQDGGNISSEQEASIVKELNSHVDKALSNPRIFHKLFEEFKPIDHVLVSKYLKELSVISISTEDKEGNKEGKKLSSQEIADIAASERDERTLIQIINENIKIAKGHEKKFGDISEAIRKISKLKAKIAKIDNLNTKKARVSWGYALSGFSKANYQRDLVTKSKKIINDLQREPYRDLIEKLGLDVPPDPTNRVIKTKDFFDSNVLFEDESDDYYSESEPPSDSDISDHGST